MGQKFCRVKKKWVGNVIGLKEFGSEIWFGLIRFVCDLLLITAKLITVGRKLFDTKKIWSKFFSPQRFFDWKFYGPQKFSDRIFFYPTKFGLEFFLDPKKFGRNFF